VALVPATPALAVPNLPAKSSDFNGDGYADVVVGESYRPYGVAVQAGAVRVIYGMASGLNPYSAVLINQAKNGVPGDPAHGSSFGYAIATGNFDGDGYADAAISAPGYGDGDGQVIVLYGSSAGLNGTPAAMAKAELLSPSQFVPITSDMYFFGGSLAVGDFNKDGRGDLVIGSPNTNAAAGDLTINYGSPSGLDTGSGFVNYTQESLDVGAVSQPGDSFGHTLAVGDFNGDHRDDLAIAAHMDRVGGVSNAGQVYVLPTSSFGVPSVVGDFAFNQDTPGVPDQVEAMDYFGISLAAGDLDGDGYDELIAGSGYEDITPNGHEGLVTVLKGSAAGPTATGATSFAGNPGDRFGYHLAVANTDGNAYRELAIAMPWRAVGAATSAGAILVLPGTAAGPSLAGSVLWTQDSPDVPDTAEAGDAVGFGEIHAMRISNSGYEGLVIGIPYEGTTDLYHCGAIMVLPGSATGLTGTGSQVYSATSLTGGGVQSAQLGNAVG
jgi:hypothetical protein